MSTDGKAPTHGRHGLQAMSIGLLIESRSDGLAGSHGHAALESSQETKVARSGYLIVDCRRAPGTSAHARPARSGTGAVIVTTPQDIASSKRAKGQVFEKVGIQIWGS